MKVTKSAIHRLEVAADCGCAASNEYSDAAYKKPVSATSQRFVSCKAHTDAPGLDLLITILSEAVTKEAKDFVLPAPPVQSAPAAAIREARTAAPANAVAPEVSEGGSVTRTALPAPAESATVVHRAAERGPRKDPLKVTQRGYSGGGGGGVSRASSGSGIPARSGVMIGGKRAAASTEIDIDFEDAAEEDPRLSSIMEDVLPGLLPGTEGSGDEFELED